MNTMMNKKELLIIGGIILCCVAAVLFLRHPRGNAVVQVIHDGVVVLEFPSEKDALYHVEGNCGGLDIEVKNNRWHVINEQCPNHICAKTGWASAENLTVITCMPNDIVIRIGEYSDEP